MDIKDIAKGVCEFQVKRFPKYGSQLNQKLIFIHAVEEVGEIARQIFSKESGMRNYDQENIKEEITQAILDLLVLAELNEVDLEEEIEKKISNMESRWNPKD